MSSSDLSDLLGAFKTILDVVGRTGHKHDAPAVLGDVRGEERDAFLVGQALDEADEIVDSGRRARPSDGSEHTVEALEAHAPDRDDGALGVGHAREEPVAQGGGDGVAQVDATFERAGGATGNQDG